MSLKEFIMRGWFRRATFLAIASVSLIAAFSADQAKAQGSEKPHRVAIQVDQKDPAGMNLPVNNPTKAIEDYRTRGEDVAVEVVTYGPRLPMLRAGTSPQLAPVNRWEDSAAP